MYKPAILAALLAAASIGFAIPAIAGDDNDPHMKMFTWDGRTFDEYGTHPRNKPGQYGKESKDGMGSGGSMMQGSDPMSPGAQSPGSK